MKKSSFLIAFAIAAATLMGTPHMAYADGSSDDEVLPPIVFLLLDTSGSMNEIFDSSTNNTRLTNALAEIIGAPTNKDSEHKLIRADCGDDYNSRTGKCPDNSVGKAFTMPFPELNKETGGYESKPKQIRENSQIARPADTTSYSTVDESYDQNGIIQDYLSTVKFGFAGFAVGSGGSVGKDSIIQQAASLGGGRTEGTKLRFTMIWGHKEGDQESTSDLDAHVFITRKDQTFGGAGHIYYSSKKALGGELDVDNTNPKNRTGIYAVCYNRSTNHMDKCDNIKESKDSYIHIGVENIFWLNLKDSSGNPIFNPGDTLTFVAQPYRMDQVTDGYDLEIAFDNGYGCPDVYTYSFESNIPNIDAGNNYSHGYPAVTLTYKADGTFDIYPKPSDESSSFSYTYNSYSVGSSTLAKDNKFIADEEYTLALSSSAGEPAHIYGMKTTPATSDRTSDTITYGLLINKEYKTKPRDCTYDMGIWDLSHEADAPLIYPTASDEAADIENNNRRLINAVRTYTATAATPIGEALADLYFMFGGANTSDIKSVDEGLTKYFDDNGSVQTDKKFNCEGRKKSVILISDGIPNGSGLLNTTENEGKHGYSVAIWHDTDALAKRNINVFVIGYSELFNSISFPNVTKGEDGTYSADEKFAASGETVEDRYGAYILSKAAWKGGTCLDENNQIIPYSDSPIDEQKFLDFLYRYGKPTEQGGHDRLCFYNALDKDSLRVAIVSALSQSTSSTFSKTPVVTTTAVGYNTSLTNVETADGTTKREYTNGFYNVFSGYKSYLGNKRDSFLERSIFICKKDQNGDYAFLPDMDTKTTNFARRHDCQIISCKSDESAGADSSTIDILNKATGLTDTQLDNPCAEREDGTNSCLSSRVIFAGDYSSARNQLYPANAKLHDGMEDNLAGESPKYNVRIGHIKDGKGPGEDYHFMTQSDPAACKRDLESDVSKLSEANKNAMYMVSPFECHSELDCNSHSGSSSKKHLCKRGRCVPKDDTSSAKTTVAQACSKHMECKFDEVCHADCEESGNCPQSFCTAGVLKNCDIRPFIASQRLGTIKYATPTVVEPPNRSYKNAEYQIFQQKYWNRDTTLLVGANDGMLHNFLLGNNAEEGAYTTSASIFSIDDSIEPNEFRSGLVTRSFEEGDEIWGFIPKSVMPKIRYLLDSGDHTNVNAAPAVADVQAPKSYYEDSSFDDMHTIKTSAGEKQVPVKWRTVAVGGFRDGGRGYYALDITNPGKPRVLWEIDPTWKATSDSESMNANFNIAEDDTVSFARFTSNLNKKDSTADYYPFMQLGKTYAQPLITTLIINNEKGEPESVPVAILSGGVSNNQSKVSDTTTIDNYIGRVMYIVKLFPKNPEDLLVKTFYFQNEITGEPSIYPNNFGLPAQLIYFGDNTGALFRLDVKSHDPDEWGSYEYEPIAGVANARFETPVFDPQEFEDNTGTRFFEKITHKPAVALYDTNNNRPIVQIAVGTGSNDVLNVNSGTNNYVGVFYDVPNIADGKYTLNPLSHPGKLLAFNSVKTSDADVLSKDGSQKFRLYVNDPAQPSEKLKEHQKMTGAPIIYNYDVYFPTYIGTQTTDGSDDVCAVGNAAIYALRHKVKDPKVDPPKHASLDKSKIQNKNATGSENVSPEIDNFLNGNTSILELEKGTRIYGLQITNQLYCGNKNGGTFAAPQLIAQTGSDAGLNAFDKDSPNNLVGKTSLSTFSLNLEGIQATSSKVKWAAVYE